MLVIDFGSQYSHLICRRCREVGVYSELRSFDITVSEIKEFSPNGVILSGGPASVYAADAPHLSKDVWETLNNFPVLGICYGMQEMVHAAGGSVAKGVKREFGFASVSRATSNSVFDDLFGLITDTIDVWMSHGDKVTKLPKGFEVLALSENTEMCVIAEHEKHWFGLQFHPEVTHTPKGTEIIRNFCKIAGCNFTWMMKEFVSKQIDDLQNKLSDPVIQVVGAVSGGVDSTVAAALLHKAIGPRFHPFMIDTGLLRKDETLEVKQRLEKHIPGLNLTVVDASNEFFKALVNVKEPEEKRKIIGRLFVESFERTVKDILQVDISNCLLLQGTLYPDVIESLSHKGPSHTIKTHHNVGGLPDRMEMKVLEPLRLLFKDEVRSLGRELNIPVESVNRHPFPGPGLAIRIIGEVTQERVDTLRQADSIFIDEIRKAGEYDKIGQAFAVLVPDVKTVGVMGDGRTYESLCCLRAVQTSDFMTASWYKMPYDLLERVSTRIINEVSGINRVCYDISSKPPATIEWE